MKKIAFLFLFLPLFDAFSVTPSVIKAKIIEDINQNTAVLPSKETYRTVLPFKMSDEELNQAYTEITSSWTSCIRQFDKLNKDEIQHLYRDSTPIQYQDLFLISSDNNKQLVHINTFKHTNFFPLGVNNEVMEGNYIKVFSSISNKSIKEVLSGFIFNRGEAGEIDIVTVGEYFIQSQLNDKKSDEVFHQYKTYIDACAQTGNFDKIVSMNNIIEEHDQINKTRKSRFKEYATQTFIDQYNDFPNDGFLTAQVIKAFVYRHNYEAAQRVLDNIDCSKMTHLDRLKADLELINSSKLMIKKQQPTCLTLPKETAY